jgi:1-acyl-sn-glycerol-3-phosphate acyltransferase
MFVAIYNYLRPRRGLALTLFAATLLLFGFLTTRLRFNEDIQSLLPESRELRQMTEVLSHTNAGEQLVFQAHFADSAFTDRDSLIRAASTYSELVNTRFPTYIDSFSVQTGGGLDEGLSGIVRDKLPLLLNESDYRSIDSMLAPEKIEASLQRSRQILMSPAGVVYKSLVATDPLGTSRLVWPKFAALQGGGAFELYDGCIFTDSGRTLTFFMKPAFPASATGKNAPFLSSLRATTDSFLRRYPQLRIDYFGGAAVAAGNAVQMRRDTILTLSLTIVLLLALTYYYFRRKRTPLILLVPVLYGAGLGLAVTYLVQGSISIIALGAGAIVMGIAIDYSIHFLSHLRMTGNIRETIHELQQPLTIGSFTTIAAFLSLRLVHLPLLRDLGLFAAVSLIGAAVCTLVFLPHFPLGKQEAIPRKTFFDRIAKFEPARSKWLLWSIILLTPVLAWFSSDIRFDDDLMHLNYLSPEMQRAEANINRSSDVARASVFVIAAGRNRDEALERLLAASPSLDSLRINNVAGSINNPAALIPSKSEQERRMQRWIAFWNEERRAAAIHNIQTAATKAGFNATAFNGFEQQISGMDVRFDAADSAILTGLFPGGFSRSSGGDTVYAIAAVKPLPSKRAAVLAAFHNQLPGISVTDRQQGASFMVRVLNQDFQSIALYSSLIVFFALLLAYGRIELALISFLPMAVSWVWILGIMALVGIKFNIVNIIISTLIFGLGDDYSIFTLDGLTAKWKTGKDPGISVRSAVYVSVTTVLIGLGVLLLAKHPALKSIAAISVTGMLCVLLISQTLQPALYRFLIQGRAEKGFLPFTLWSLSKSTFSFLYFLSCSLAATLFGLVLIGLRPFGKKRSKLIFHRIISAATWSVLHIMTNTRKRIVNKRAMDFSRPAVYIANHSSFLDILLTTALNPRMVLLTNKWVYRSPVFGGVVRLAEYYPVADGAEDSLEPLQGLVSRGYSIMVFPEGTRSRTDEVHRFHKGAFYIAEKLGLDMVPLIIHGAHYTMEKGDWLLKDGILTVHAGERNPPGTTPYGPLGANSTGLADYSRSSKLYNKWFRETLANIKEKDETPSYFREQLLRSYLYKGPVLEWYCRIKTALEGNYEGFHRLLPRKGRIYDLGCGYGFASYMLHWAAEGREIRGVDYDESKTEVAQALHLRDNSVSFEAADLRAYPLEPADGILLLDVLHYLMPDEQTQLLQKCTDALNPGGVLIVREGVTELVERQKGTALTELFSTKLLGFNRTTNKLHFLSGTKLEAFAKERSLALEIIDATKRTSNLVFVFRK